VIIIAVAAYIVIYQAYWGVEYMQYMPDGAERKSNIIINDRKDFSINGVFDVYNFDESNVSLKTALGDLSVDGDELKITKLSIETGEVCLTGKISGIFYRDEIISAGGFLKRFKGKNS